jgi:hypothetical protein
VNAPPSQKKPTKTPTSTPDHLPTEVRLLHLPTEVCLLKPSPKSRTGILPVTSSAETSTPHRGLPSCTPHRGLPSCTPHTGLSSRPLSSRRDDLLIARGGAKRYPGIPIKNCPNPVRGCPLRTSSRRLWTAVRITALPAHGVRLPAPLRTRPGPADLPVDPLPTSPLRTSSRRPWTAEACCRFPGASPPARHQSSICLIPPLSKPTLRQSPEERVFWQIATAVGYGWISAKLQKQAHYGNPPRSARTIQRRLQIIPFRIYIQTLLHQISDLVDVLPPHSDMK